VVFFADSVRHLAGFNLELSPWGGGGYFARDFLQLYEILRNFNNLQLLTGSLLGGAAARPLSVAEKRKFSASPRETGKAYQPPRQSAPRRQSLRQFPPEPSPCSTWRNYETQRSALVCQRTARTINAHASAVIQRRGGLPLHDEENSSALDSVKHNLSVYLEHDQLRFPFAGKAR